MNFYFLFLNYIINYVYPQENIAEEEFSAAILIVRNPLDALVAEWNRRTYSIAKKLAYPQRGSPHIASLPQMYFSEYI